MIKIDFIHTDGKPYQFQAKQNPLTGDWMYTWDNWYGCFRAESKHEINTIVKNINKTGHGPGR